VVLQLAWLYHALKRSGTAITMPRPRFDGDTKKLLTLMGPGVIGAGVMHINLFADMIIASLLPAGAISYLYYADRLNQLPLGMVGIAVGTALLPMLSRAVASADQAEAAKLFNRALEICLFLALPAAVGLYIIAQPIIMTLFQHGAFDFTAAAMTSAVLAAYALGLPAYVATKVYATTYWARQDTMSPVKASVACALFNIAMSLFLVFYAGAGVVGIAVSTSLAGWLQVALLHRGLRGRAETQFDARFKKNLLKILLSCFVMGACLYGLKPLFGDLYLTPGVARIDKIGALAVLVMTGMAVYGAAALLSGIVKLGELKMLLKRGPKTRS